MRKLRDAKCLNCNKEYQTVEKKSKFCGKSCAAHYNNARRAPFSFQQKVNISNGVKRYYEENKEKVFEKSTNYTRGKYNTYPPETMLLLSKRTVSKIFKRLNVGCSNCGWNEARCDLHHIGGRGVENPHDHTNLAYLCPNCHRLAHVGKLLPEQMISLTTYIGDGWKKHYYG